MEQNSVNCGRNPRKTALEALYHRLAVKKKSRNSPNSRLLGVRFNVNRAHILCSFYSTLNLTHMHKTLYLGLDDLMGSTVAGRYAFTQVCNL